MFKLKMLGKGIIFRRIWINLLGMDKMEYIKLYKIK